MTDEDSIGTVVHFNVGINVHIDSITPSISSITSDNEDNNEDNTYSYSADIYDNFFKYKAKLHCDSGGLPINNQTIKIVRLKVSLSDRHVHIYQYLRMPTMPLRDKQYISYHPAYIEAKSTTPSYSNIEYLATGQTVFAIKVRVNRKTVSVDGIFHRVELVDNSSSTLNSIVALIPAKLSGDYLFNRLQKGKTFSIESGPGCKVNTWPTLESNTPWYVNTSYFINCSKQNPLFLHLTINAIITKIPPQQLTEPPQPFSGPPTKKLVLQAIYFAPFMLVDILGEVLRVHQLRVITKRKRNYIKQIPHFSLELKRGSEAIEVVFWAKDALAYSKMAIEPGDTLYITKLKCDHHHGGSVLYFLSISDLVKQTDKDVEMYDF
ncbi:hypothetical protein DFA_11251 [Cavenderia fasciculata]|uniref:Uncharacterized protein n=1 Tax=Cavenderia fasciculata TaxID=261658 RepID=F4QFN7_CACFS|nr:uncharacterized protein DFA_11251 [Cavenderia fasciculata]EGG13490.1 hypothetical protein DFA_11251 [Cavenderia fasciculata]|eukprot:XP_004350194.1 hypothetical protein DFA_11251 [Cavenderia fasciculata]